MRSSTGAVVLVATAAALLFAWPGSAASGVTPPSGASREGVPSPDLPVLPTSDGPGSGAGPLSVPSLPADAAVPVDRGEPVTGTMSPVVPSADAGPGDVAPRPTPPRNTVLVLGSVFFPSNATGLGPDATRMLDGIAATYKGTSQRLQIVGHADGRGSAQANLRLSAQRADAVRRYLASNGIPSGNMTVSYDGARTPMARGVDPEANAQNRRVEVRVP